MHERADVPETDRHTNRLQYASLLRLRAPRHNNDCWRMAELELWIAELLMVLVSTEMLTVPACYLSYITTSHILIHLCDISYTNLHNTADNVKYVCT